MNEANNEWNKNLESTIVLLFLLSLSNMTEQRAVGASSCELIGVLLKWLQM
jgi:hypothetical protein